MADPTMTVEQLKARIAELEREKAAASNAAITMKVSDKGGVSVYGLGRFPLTLYHSQWDKLLANTDSIKAFIKANGDKLAHKPAKE